MQGGGFSPAFSRLNVGLMCLFVVLFMVNNYSSFIVVVVVLAFYLSPFSGLKLGHVIMSVCVATS